MPEISSLVFCGTPAFAVPALEKLVQAGLGVRLVVTQPDRPKGRGLELALSPVKQRALQLGLPVIQPDKIKNNEEFRNQLAVVKPDAIIVVGYGRIIPAWMLDFPPLGNLNLHGSLLPKYRGAAPVQWAIAHGETVTGVTTMRIDAGLDTGDILLQKEIAIAQDDTAETLAPRMAAAGADLMVETIRGLQAGTIHPRPQDDSAATLAPILKKEDGRINFHLTAWEILIASAVSSRGPVPTPVFAGRICRCGRRARLTAHLQQVRLSSAVAACSLAVVQKARWNCSKYRWRERSACQRQILFVAIRRSPVSCSVSQCLATNN